MSATWDDLVEGRGPEPREIGPLTRTDIVRYQGASGDFNPIHHDEEFAVAAGHPSVFSVGMLQAGFAAAYCTDWLGAEHVRRFSVQFREQVWPGDRLVCTATVAAKHDDGGERRVDVDVRVTRVASGGPAVVGSASFVVP